MFLRSHCITFVQFTVSVRINVSSCFSGHTVLSSFGLLLVSPLTSSNVSPVTLYYLRSVYCLCSHYRLQTFLRSHRIIFVQFIVSVRINVSSCFSGHTVFSSLSLLLLFALTSSDVSPVTLYFLRSVYC